MSKRNRQARALSSTQNECWKTPPSLVNLCLNIHGVTEFDLDPATLERNIPARNHYTPKDDGLKQPWEGKVFCNPPYSRGKIDKFLTKAVREVDRADTILVLPVDTSTKWFHEILVPHTKLILFTKGRVAFINNKVGTGKGLRPTMLVLVGEHWDIPAVKSRIRQWNSEGNLPEVYHLEHRS